MVEADGCGSLHPKASKRKFKHDAHKAHEEESENQKNGAIVYAYGEVLLLSVYTRFSCLLRALCALRV
jgi:hypothetical protein